MGTGSYIKNAEEEKVKRIEQWKQESFDEYIRVSTITDEPLLKKEEDIVSRRALPKVQDAFKNNDKKFLEKFLIGTKIPDWTTQNTIDYAKWSGKVGTDTEKDTAKKNLSDILARWNEERENEKTLYKATDSFKDRVKNKIESNADSMASTVRNFVDKTGLANTEGLKNVLYQYHSHQNSSDICYHN